MAETSWIPSIQDIQNAYSWEGIKSLFSGSAEGAIHPLNGIINASTGQLTQDQIAAIAAENTPPGTPVQDTINFINGAVAQGAVGTRGAFNGRGPAGAAVDAVTGAASDAADAITNNIGNVVFVALLILILVIVVMQVF